MRFMKGIHFQGIGAVGIKLDSRDGVFKLIELNARTWMQNELSARAGLPLVLMEYQDLIGRSLEVPDDHLDGLRWWDCVSDADSFWRLRRRGQSTATSWIRYWFGSEVYAYFALDDIRPGLRSIGYGLEIARAGQNMLRSKVDEDLV
jgi:predicted ATP-grasp superfamily ATP-dependent carboligase